jgi:protein Xni
MIRLLIIDGLNLVRRIYSALPVVEGDAPDIQQFLNACDKAFKHILDLHQPSHAVCVFEHYASTWRHDLYPPYKANRKPQPEAMLASFSRLRVILEAHGVSWLDIVGYEADDIIASIVQTTHTHDCQNLILSTDHLMAQLIDDKTRLHDHFNHKTIDHDVIFKRYGIRPDQLADYFALVGSNSVNVPGVVGIGAKTAMALLTEFDHCEALLNAAELPAKTAKQMKGSEHAIYLYRALFTLRRDCPVGGNVKDWRVALRKIS